MNLKTSATLYDATNIDSLPWPASEQAENAKNFVIPLIKNGVKHYIDNIDTTMMALAIDHFVLPVSVNNTEYDNSYVCSPYGQYIVYAREALADFSKVWLRKPILGLLWGLGKLLRKGKINKVVIVNNWLFSTNLHPPLTQHQITVIRECLKKHFPDHAIIFRSVHTYEGRDFYSALKSNAFNLIASRQVFFLNTKKEEIFSTRIFKSDLKLLRETNYEILDHHEIPADAVQKLAALYSAVYTEKHSKQNPQLNVRFIQLALECKILQLIALCKDGNIDAVAGFYCRNGVMTSPMVGYNTASSKEDKLYRLTATALTQEARKQGMLFHLSSGASFFKKIRRGEGHIEFTGVYHKHLSMYRRLPWWILRGISNTIGIKVMKLYDR